MNHAASIFLPHFIVNSSSIRTKCSNKALLFTNDAIGMLVKKLTTVRLYHLFHCPSIRRHTVSVAKDVLFLDILLVGPSMMGCYECASFHYLQAYEIRCRINQVCLAFT